MKLRNIHKIHIQIGCIAIGSPLEPVIANIFMVELEDSLVPKLSDYVEKRRRFVDDTFAYVKNGSVEYVLSILRSFQKKVKFNYEEEQSHSLQFSYILLVIDDGNLNTTVYRKHMLNNLYVH